MHSLSKSGTHPLLKLAAHFYSLHVTDGDLGHRGDALQCYMKQKHRMIWERRHGPVGSGRKNVIEPERER